jgi:CRISPR-associated protein Cas2
MVYDVNIKRVSKVLKISRMYLTWVQNSVLEGEITEANFMKLKKRLDEVIDKKEDTITFYILKTTTYMRKETIGIIKGETTQTL